MKHVLKYKNAAHGLAEVHGTFSLAHLRAGLFPVQALSWDGPGPNTSVCSIPDLDFYAQTGVASPGSSDWVLTHPGAAAFALESVERPRSSALHLTRGEGPDSVLPITVLPPWSWPHEPGAGLLAAALVSPLAYEGMLPDALASVEEVVLALKGRAPWSHVKAQVCREPWTASTFQPVRSPEELLHSRDSAVSATCLDLSLLVAGALEYAGHAALVVLTGTRSAPPEHAMTGFWRCPGTRVAPLLDRDTLRAQVEAGELDILESTFLSSPEVGFQSALHRGRTNLLQADEASAIDIAAARPPWGRSHPLGPLWEPVAAKALHLAADFASRLGAPYRECAHMLYGICAAGGAITRWLLSEAGTAPGTLCRLAEAMLPKGEARPAFPTRNYEACLTAARRNASNGEGRVREQDLLWAVLETQSRTVGGILDRAGAPLPALRALLASRHPQPGAATSLRWGEGEEP